MKIVNFGDLVIEYPEKFIEERHVILPRNMKITYKGRRIEDKLQSLIITISADKYVKVDIKYIPFLKRIIKKIKGK